MRALILAVALFTGQPGPSAPPDPAPAAADGRILVESGYVFERGLDNGGWIQFARSRMRFRFPPSAGEDPAYAQLVTASEEGSVSLRVRYDATRGRVSAAGGYVEYPICSMSMAGRPGLGDERVNCPASAETRAQTPENDLALGLAMVPTRPAEARRLLGRALEGGALRGRLRGIALEARGQAAEALADRLPWASEDYDRAMADALADYRAWVASEPGEMDAQYAASYALANLGGYAEAQDVLRAIVRRWPDEEYRAVVSIGALYRQQGLYPEALRALDDYAARHGPQEGMRFYYHRAWTLNLLDRPREALDALTRGMESQPDYAYAYFMRACSNAKLGQLREALADQERGLALLTDAARDNPELHADNLATSRAAAEALRGLVASGRRRPSEVPCNALWQRDIRSRPRSALLGPARG